MSKEPLATSSRSSITPTAASSLISLHNPRTGRIMVNIQLLGGVGEIGGNKFLIRDEDSKILLDFGMSLGLRGQFFSEPFLAPRDGQGLISLGILPDIHDLYRDGGDPPVDAVILSHSHIDHSMCISLLRSEERRVGKECRSWLSAE